MNEESVTESAKAVQEVAKASSTAIKATEKLGAYVAKLIKEPADSIIGILSDKLKFIRWERQLRLLDRVQEKVKQKKLEGKLLQISPKLALPIIENATLEEDDYLQDLWANLLIEAGNPQSKDKVRTAFIDIIKQLEPIDARILEGTYELSVSKLEEYKLWCDDRYIKNTPPLAEISQLSLKKQEDFTEESYNLYKSKLETFHHLYKVNSKKDNISPLDMSISKTEILQCTHISTDDYIVSIDNLMRLRCLRSYTIDENIEIGNDDPFFDETYTVTRDYQYNEFCLTALGCNFVQICMTAKE